MKKLYIASAFTLILSSTPVLAEKINAEVEDHYRTVVREIPQTERICEMVEVPIYGQDSFDQDRAIIGGIIGGVIGNQVGGGSGKEAATGVGALAGAIIGGKREAGIVGYRQQENCHLHTTYTREQKEVYSHSTISFKDENGRLVTLQFQR